MLNKPEPFGTEFIEIVKKLPQYSMRLEIISIKRMRVKIIQTNKNYSYENKPHNGITLIVGDSNNKLLMFNDNV